MTTPPATARRDVLLLAGLLMVPVALLLGLVLAPADAIQGDAQRLMYLHVPAAWSTFGCFFVVLVANVRYLRARTVGADALARGAAEVGVGLTALTLATGSVWGALTWGTWWVWDARVTTTVAMGLVYVIYLGARALATGPRGRTVAAALGAAGFVVVPLVHFSVLWWRTLHQPPTILAPGTGMPIDATMAAALGAAVLTASLLTAWGVRERRRTWLARARVPAVPEERPAVRVEGVVE